MSSYAATEVRNLTKRGPYPGEDFYRMKLTGNGETRWVNVTPEQVDAIAALLDVEEVDA